MKTVPSTGAKVVFYGFIIICLSTILIFDTLGYGFFYPANESTKITLEQTSEQYFLTACLTTVFNAFLTILFYILSKETAKYKQYPPPSIPWPFAKKIKENINPLTTWSSFILLSLMFNYQSWQAFKAWHNFTDWVSNVSPYIN